MAHEIGHNLDLEHVGIDQNLMVGTPFTGFADGERLNSSQIAAALASPLSAPVSTPIPVPSSVWLFASGLIGIKKITKD